MSSSLPSHATPRYRRVSASAPKADTVGTFSTSRVYTRGCTSNTDSTDSFWFAYSTQLRVPTNFMHRLASANTSPNVIVNLPPTSAISVVSATDVWQPSFDHITRSPSATLSSRISYSSVSPTTLKWLFVEAKSMMLRSSRTAMLNCSRK